MIYEIFMPALSSTMTEGKITAWVKSPGDRVDKGETVVIVESDKADMDVESFYAGFLGAIVTPAGESAPVGAAIAYIAETEAEIAVAQAQAPVATHNVTNGNAQPEPIVASPVAVLATAHHAPDRLIASPRAKRLAKDHRLDLGTIVGTGPQGRITAEDVEKLLTSSSLPSSAPILSKPIAPSLATVAPAPVSQGAVQPLTTLQQAVVRNMNASMAVPVFHVGYTITTTALDGLYKQVKSKGVSMTVLLAKAVAITLQKHPIVNGFYTDQGIAYRSDINIAVAVAMDDGGLITPVLSQADKTDIYSLGRQWQSLVERARHKQLQPAEYTSGTFTISNLGMFGVDRFDAILPPGTGAILAVGASRPAVVANAEGAITIRSQMQVNLTCDHRHIYGAHAAQFLKDLANLLESSIDQLTR